MNNFIENIYGLTRVCVKLILTEDDRTQMTG